MRLRGLHPDLRAKKRVTKRRAFRMNPEGPSRAAPRQSSAMNARLPRVSSQRSSASAAAADSTVQSSR